MTLQRQLEEERQYHESEDKLRDANGLISGVYSSGVFAEAEAFHLDALGDLNGAAVLDYGCGTGGSTVALWRRGAKVTAFDIAHTRLLEAGGRGRAEGLGRPGFVQCAAEQLPFATNSFDAVFGKQILHHLQLETAIGEIARVLRPGGRAAFLEPLIHNPLLEGYRRLTPRLRSPTERALSMRDLKLIAAHFRDLKHQEFCFLSVVPALGQALTGKTRFWTAVIGLLSRLDRALLEAAPFVGRYYWETVITVVK